MDQLVAALPGQHRHFQKASATSKAAGTWQSLWTATGQPGAGAAQGSTTGAVPTSATAGAFTFTDPGSGNSYLGKLTAAGSTQGTLILYDRLWHNSGLSGIVTTAQTWTQAALTRPDALGTDVEAWIEWYTATGATSTTATISYTNQAGTSGKSGTATTPVSPVAGQMLPFNLAAGDTGIRSIASLTLTATTGTAGNFGVTLLRRIAEFPLNVTNVTAVYDAFSLGMPQIYNSACLALMVMCSTTNTGAMVGSIDIVQG